MSRLIRLVSLVVVVAVLVGATFASAANLGVGGGSVQAGADTALVCDHDGVTVSWNVNYDGIVTSIQVYGVDAACAGNRMVARIEGDTGQMIGTNGNLTNGGAPVVPAAYVIPDGGGTVKLELAPTDANGVNVSGGHGVPAQAIYGIELYIEGEH
ncbi:MAG: hypothetical protein HPY83_07925 [Anaerolineae bacterium]|nr:hypothetical protein [Anaerolineae bacterium]